MVLYLSGLFPHIFPNLALLLPGLSTPTSQLPSSGLESMYLINTTPLSWHLLELTNPLVASYLSEFLW